MPDLPDWARAWGPALIDGVIRSMPRDFVVEEILDIDFAGEGEHDWLCVEKTGANTHWVAEQLAKYAGVPARDVGYSGLKDRHAVTTQWFSVRRTIAQPTDWDRFEADGARILDRQVHSRKLKRGTHRKNRFSIVVRSPDLATQRAHIDARLERIRAAGVPNYFGEQRFGRRGANLDLGQAILDGRRVSRAKRSIGLSALRSFEFNESLAARVAAGTWNTLSAGDVAALEGTSSVFTVDTVTPDLEKRCAELDIHPAGELPAIEALGVRPAHRSLRMTVHDLEWEFGDGSLRLDFRLGRGCFATAVLRELANYSTG